MIVFELIGNPALCGEVSLATEPKDPKVYVYFYGTFEQALIWVQDCELDEVNPEALSVEDFTEHLSRTIDHELFHLFGLTRNECGAYRFEAAGAWARERK